MKDRHSSGGLPVEEIAESGILTTLVHVVCVVYTTSYFSSVHADQQYESGSMLHSGNISLPPPTKNLGSLAMGRNTWATGPSAVVGKCMCVLTCIPKCRQLLCANTALR